MSWFTNIKKSLLSTDSELGGQSFTSPFSETTATSRKRLIGEYSELVYSCVTVISEEIGQYTPQFYKTVNGDQVIIPDHPMLLLLQNPNRYMTQYAMWEAVQSYVELAGEAFLAVSLGERTGLPMQLDLIRPDKVEVAVQDQPDPTGEHQIGDVIGYTIATKQGTPIPMSTREMIHIKTFNPFNPYRGYSTVEAGLTSIGIDTSTSRFQKHFMDNNAIPQSIVTFKGNIGVDAFNRIKRIFTERHAGVQNAGKTLFIRDTDIDVRQLGLSLGDLDMQALKTMSADRVRGMFRVPRPLLGDTDSAGLGRSAVETQEYIFQKYTIEPKKTRIDDALTLACRTYWPNDIVTVGHESNIPEDRASLLAEQVALVDTVYSRNEIREQRGDDRVAGGDQLYVPFNMTPIAESDDTPDVETPDAASETFKAVRKRHVAKATPSPSKVISMMEQLERAQSERYIKVISKELERQKTKVLEFYGNIVGKTVEILELADDTYTMLEKVFPILKQTITGGADIGNLILQQPDREFLLEQRQLDRIWDEHDKILSKFNDDTREQIQKQIAIGHANGETPAQVEARIKDVYSQAEQVRAERVARTEQHRLANQGLADAYQIDGYTHLEWKAQADACSFCREMDGTITEIGGVFIPEGGTITDSDGKTFTNTYIDVQYADAHPNCNCVLLPATTDDATKAQIKVVTKIEQIDSDETEMLRRALMEQTDYAQQLEKIAGIYDGSDEEN